MSSGEEMTAYLISRAGWAINCNEAASAPWYNIFDTRGDEVGNTIFGLRPDFFYGTNGMSIWYSLKLVDALREAGIDGFEELLREATDVAWVEVNDNGESALKMAQHLLKFLYDELSEEAQ